MGRWNVGGNSACVQGILSLVRRDSEFCAMAPSQRLELIQFPGWWLLSFWPVGLLRVPQTLSLGQSGCCQLRFSLPAHKAPAPALGRGGGGVGRVMALAC